MSEHVASKPSEAVNADSLYVMKICMSCGTGLLLFFYVIPLILAVVESSLDISYEGSSYFLGSIKILLYYVLNLMATIVVVKFQNRKLARKSLGFKKVYCIIISLLLCSAIVVRLFLR